MSALAPAPDRTAIAEARGVTRVYGSGHRAVTALAGVDLAIAPGEYVALHGRSGSGKTTLLNLLGGLDEPTEGSIAVAGTRLADLDEQARATVRRDRIAFVFQTFGLLPVLSALENVEVPLRLAKVAPTVRRERALTLLEQVGLAARADHRPHELSGGEQQRVAVARSLANEPDLLIADEPTGQLDSETGASVMAVIETLIRDRGMAAIVATHDPLLLARADRVLAISDGRLT